MGIAHEKPMADRLFELADMVAHGRLTQTEFPACFGETISFRDHKEGLQEHGIEHRPSLSAKTITLISIIGVHKWKDNKHYWQCSAMVVSTAYNDKTGDGGKNDAIFATQCFGVGRGR
jgi:hypothetical protein